MCFYNKTENYAVSVALIRRCRCSRIWKKISCRSSNTISRTFFSPPSLPYRFIPLDWQPPRNWNENPRVTLQEKNRTRKAAPGVGRSVWRHPLMLNPMEQIGGNKWESKAVIKERGGKRLYCMGHCDTYTLVELIKFQLKIKWNKNDFH